MNKIVIFLFCIFSVQLFAQEADWKDIEGSSDHQMISRFKGSVITRQTLKDYDSFDFVTKIKTDGISANVADSKREEGRYFKTFYKVKSTTSPLEITKSYENELKRKGFKILLKQELEDNCAFMFLYANLKYNAQNEDGKALIGGIGAKEKKLILISGVLERKDGDVFVSVMAISGDNTEFVNNNGVYGYRTGPFSNYVLDIVECKPLETGKVTVAAASIAKDIEKDSHSSVYGILFDTGKAEVKPESAETLSEISKVLNGNQKLKLFVVGHTDNEGTYEYNLDLSKKRAESVVTELVSKYKIDQVRLVSQGVGQTCPITSNKTEDGKARNRRVELVEQ
ncbi:MAG: hypothetical protein A2231_06700 [Candidatus Firestonebacteria bacterium RIFOXYA2_FULL_40_8]|nr:MAG: hypothetical protein A2231_06700 [Candidatus Firestonebacteria bacterium RIFOXYA2_FULL_40_8]